MKPIEKISVVGLGTLGTQIAIQAAAYGYAVCGFDPEPSAFAKMQTKVRGAMQMTGKGPTVGMNMADIMGGTRTSYNVCPTDTVDTIVFEQGVRGLVPMRWGLVPRWWSKPLKEIKLATFNARAETVTTKPFFRHAFRRTRCLIPISGYYEWQDTSDGKQPCIPHGDRPVHHSYGGSRWL